MPSGGGGGGGTSGTTGIVYTVQGSGAMASRRSGSSELAYLERTSGSYRRRAAAATSPRSTPRFTLEPSFNAFHQLEMDAASASAGGATRVAELLEQESIAALGAQASPSPRRRLDVEPR